LKVISVIQKPSRANVLKNTARDNYVGIIATMEHHLFTSY